MSSNVDPIAKAKEIAAKLGVGVDLGSSNVGAVSMVDATAGVSESTLTTTNPNPPTTTTSKRKRWGVGPDNNNNSSNSGGDLTTGEEEVSAKKQKQEEEGSQDSHVAAAIAAAASKAAAAAAKKHQRRLWITVTDEKPAHHYRIYWEKNHIEIARQVSPGTVSLKLQGRGSSATSTPLPGVPEEPLHVLVEAPTINQCDLALQLLEELFLQRAQQIPLLQDEHSTKQQQNHANAATKKDGNSSSSSYTPAPVAALIHNHSGLGHALNPNTNNLVEEKMGVPNSVVGYIIGRGGESIASMQAKTQCRVQIQREQDMNPGQTERIITLQAATTENIAACRDIINNMVRERTHSHSHYSNNNNHNNSNHNNNNAPLSQDAKLQQAIAAGHVLVKVPVPDGDVGLIIGKGGTTIKSIQDQSGANIQIPPSGDAENPHIRTVSVTHPNQQGATMAQELILNVLGSKKNSHNGSGGNNSNGPHITLQVEIPDKDVGMCIGRSGCVIREMQSQSGTRIQIPSFSTPGQGVRIATVVGPSDGCHRVKQMIERIILEQSSQSVMSASGDNGGHYQQHHHQQHQYQQHQRGNYHNYGGGYGGHYQNDGYHQQQQQGYNGHGYSNGGGYQQQGQRNQTNAGAASGERDYSAEWAAYYAAQGQTAGGNANGAAAQTKTSSSPAGEATASSATAPAAAAGTSSSSATATTNSTEYHEQFFRYAYYYGEEAARKYYGAWAPAPGTPNPYGVNPNGTSPAPDAAPAADSTAADNPANRETGRRGVSNLPAWMTGK